MPGAGLLCKVYNCRKRPRANGASHLAGPKPQRISKALIAESASKFNPVLQGPGHDPLRPRAPKAAQTAPEAASSATAFPATALRPSSEELGAKAYVFIREA